IARGIIPLIAAAAVFVATDPMAVIYFSKFRDDINTWIVGPHSGTWRPIFVTQFTDINTTTYWFTNLLWWGLGPAFEFWGLLGILWLVLRRDRRMIVA